MTKRKEDLHGNAPDKCAVALLLVDVVNDLEFPGNQEIVKTAPPMARRLKRLKDKARREGIPIIYVNDNFGKWRSDFRQQVDHCLRDDVRGKPLVEILKPELDDYFVLKPKHSGFFSSTLDILLRYLNARTLIIAGIAGDRCVLFTANDAFLRDYQIFVPADCVVSNDKRQNRDALQLMKRVLRADIRLSTKLPLRALKREK
jgi:nicotinamidase-related amidase